MKSEVPDSALASLWLSAIAHPPIRATLESIYTEAASAITARGPSCWASGRCCNFDKHGHRLYVTGLEAAYCIANLPLVPTVPPVGRGLPRQPADAPGTPAFTSLPILTSTPQPACPFQVRNLCGVHTIKPLGCRIYFCDKSAQQWQQDLSEQLLARLRTLHDEHGIEYRYGEWRDMLRRFGVHAAP